MAGRNNKRRDRRLGLAFLAAAAVGVLVTELRKPAGQREWHGRIAGLVPYDVRPPTVARVRERMFNAHDPHLLVPHAFGVGWTVNFGYLYQLVAGKPDPTSL